MAFARALGPKTMNTGGPDPIQGFDAGVWVYDQQTGAQTLAGQFTSVVITVRNATEAYLEMGQRIPRYLDGEIQIAYVLEKGWLDINCLQQTFGLHGMTRSRRFGRSPRLKIVCAVRSVDEDVLNEATFNDPSAGTAGLVRSVGGQIALLNCKPDSWHIALSAGRQAAANQWQGVAEGIYTKANDSGTARFADSSYAASAAGLDALADTAAARTGKSYTLQTTSSAANRSYLPDVGNGVTSVEALFT